MIPKRYKLESCMDLMGEFWVVFDRQEARVASAEYANVYSAITELDRLNELEDKAKGVINGQL
jgi:hypothetical protein